MGLETINAFQTDYGLLWISNKLELIRFDGEAPHAAAAWDQFCRHVLTLLSHRPPPPKRGWLRRLLGL